MGGGGSNLRGRWNDVSGSKERCELARNLGQYANGSERCSVEGGTMCHGCAKCELTRKMGRGETIFKGLDDISDAPKSAN